MSIETILEVKVMKNNILEERDRRSKRYGGGFIQHR